MRLFRSRALPWTLVALTSAAAVTFAVLWIAEPAGDEREAEVERTAREFVLALTDFRSDTIDADIEEIRAFAAGEFAQEVDDLFSAETIDAIQRADATSEGEVRSVYVEELSGERATVFVVAQETRSNSLSPTPVTDTIRMSIGLVVEDGTWKVERLRLFQTPSETPFG